MLALYSVMFRLVPRFWLPVGSQRRRVQVLFGLGLLGCLGLLLGAPAAHGQALAPQNPRLAQLIDSLDCNDQQPFQRLVRGEISGDSAKVQSTRVYRQNYEQLLRIIRQYGYPSFALVGPEALEHFNNMVFHCSFAPAFQQRALRLFARQARRQPALRGNTRYLHDVAYLTDKVTRPQVYGTQLNYNKTGAFLLPTRDVLHLNERRASMHLEPVAAYLAKATALNRQMNPKYKPLGEFYPGLKRELDSLYAVQQLCQRLALGSATTRERDSVMAARHLAPAQMCAALRSLLVATDSTNLTRVRQLIQQYGYPGKTLVGTPTNEVAFYLLQASTRTREYLPLLQQVAQQGEVPYRLYALMLDRQLMRDQQAQVYGTQGRGYPATNPRPGQAAWQTFIWPIADPAHVDERRRQAGFDQTVAENARRLGIVYEAVSLRKARRLSAYQRAR